MKQLRGKPLRDFLRRTRRPEVELAFLLQDIEDPVNVGSAFRIADACGAAEIILTGISARPPHPLIAKVGRGRDRRVSWRYVETAPAAIAPYRGDGWDICALEITAESQPYCETGYGDRVLLVAGHEDHGVTNRTLAACDRAVYIPMYGKGSSLNVGVSLAVAAFHVLHRGGRR